MDTPTVPLGALSAGFGMFEVFTRSNTGLLIAGAIIGLAAITAGTARIAEAINQRRPEIIKARGEARALEIAAEGEVAVRQIMAASESNALARRTATRSALLLLGTNPPPGPNRRPPCFAGT